MEYTVKRGGHRDLKRIYPMLEFDFHDWERPREGELHAAMCKGGAELLLLKDEAGVEAGYAVMLRDRPLGCALLGWLGVYPTARGAGVGGRFLERIKAYYAGWQGILLEVTEYPALEKARRLCGFYARHGWTALPCAYRIGGRETALMWLPLEAAEAPAGQALERLVRAVYAGLYASDRLFRRYISVVARAARD